MKMLKKIGRHLVRRYERFYQGRYFHLTADIILLTIIISLASVLIAVSHYHPEAFNFSVPAHQTKITTSSPEINSSSTPQKAPSDLKVQAMIYYNSPQGDQLGTGPIPPIAGIPTTYWLFFKAENSGAEVRDFLMSARLPANVVFTGTQTLSAGTVSYQASRHLLIWKISDLPKEKIGYSAGLEIALTPLKKQVGKFCPLAGNIRYSAHDQEADYDFSGQLKDMTSALDFDKINQGQGKVEAQE